MSSTNASIVTSASELQTQLDWPNPEVVWERALEVFGDEAKARGWMNDPRPIFGGRSPQQLADSGDRGQLRTALEVLIRIEYGVFS